MPSLNPNNANAFQAGEFFPELAGKVSNLNADVFLIGETFPSLESLASAIKRLLLMGVG